MNLKLDELTKEELQKIIEKIAKRLSKEQYEYLIDEYGVELIVAPDYVSKNNLHSLKTAAAHLSNSYIIPCDIWCEKNPYSRNELYSWYMVSDLVDDDSTVRVNRKQELVA